MVFEKALSHCFPVYRFCSASPFQLEVHLCIFEALCLIITVFHYYICLFHFPNFPLPTPLFWILYFPTGFVAAGPLMAEPQVPSQWKTPEMSQISLQLWPSISVRLPWWLSAVRPPLPLSPILHVAETWPGTPAL